MFTFRGIYYARYYGGEGLRKMPVGEKSERLIILYKRGKIKENCIIVKTP